MKLLFSYRGGRLSSEFRKIIFEFFRIRHLKYELVIILQLDVIAEKRDYEV